MGPNADLSPNAAVVSCDIFPSSLPNANSCEHTHTCTHLQAFWHPLLAEEPFKS